LALPPVSSPLFFQLQPANTLARRSDGDAPHRPYTRHRFRLSFLFIPNNPLLLGGIPRVTSHNLCLSATTCGWRCSIGAVPAGPSFFSRVGEIRHTYLTISHPSSPAASMFTPLRGAVLVNQVFPRSSLGADVLGDDVLRVVDSLKLKAPVLVGHSIAGQERFPKRNCVSSGRSMATDAWGSGATFRVTRHFWRG